MLADVTIAGRKRKVFYQAGRNGWFYVVDRTNGKFILMQPFTKVTSVTGYDRARGIGTVDAAMKPRPGKDVFTCPAFFGGDTWWSYSYDPQTGYAYVPTMKTCMTMGALKPAPFKAGAGYLNASFTVEHVPGEGRLRRDGGAPGCRYRRRCLRGRVAPSGSTGTGIFHGCPSVRAGPGGTAQQRPMADTGSILQLHDAANAGRERRWYQSDRLPQHCRVRVAIEWPPPRREAADHKAITNDASELDESR